MKLDKRLSPLTDRRDLGRFSHRLLSEGHEWTLDDFIAKNKSLYANVVFRLFLLVNLLTQAYLVMRLAGLLHRGEIQLDVVSPWDPLLAPSGLLQGLYGLTVLACLLFFWRPGWLLGRRQAERIYRYTRARWILLAVTLVTLLWLCLLNYHYHVQYLTLTNSNWGIMSAVFLTLALSYASIAFIFPSLASLMLGILFASLLDDPFVQRLLAPDQSTHWFIYFANRLVRFTAGQEFENLQLMRALVEASNLDPLLNIPNRRAFFSTVEKRLSRLQARGGQAVVLMLDVDHFKRYNDHYGHLQGDACLQTVADCLRRGIRDEVDNLGRYGGEEFVVYLEDTDLAGARVVAQRIQRLLAEAALPHAASPTAPWVTISIGMAPLQAGLSLAAALDQADQALYRVKQQGRNGVGD